MRKTKLYTDGSYISRKKSGAWAYVRIDENNERFYNCERVTKVKYKVKVNSSRMELMAVINALKSLGSEKWQVEIYTDYEDIIKSVDDLINNRIKIYKKKNNDLYSELVDLCSLHEVTWIKVENINKLDTPHGKAHWMAYVKAGGDRRNPFKHNKTPEITKVINKEKNE